MYFMLQHKRSSLEIENSVRLEKLFSDFEFSNTDLLYIFAHAVRCG